jgi:transcriptional regulator GlxA family with amidase domain
VQIAIVVYPGMTALDAIGPYEVLNLVPGRELRFVWKEPGPVVTDSRALVIGATHRLADTLRPDVVLVPGSSADTGTVAADDEVIAWLRAVHPHTRFTTSVCSGAVILAAAGLLHGRPATTHWMAMPILGQLGAIPRPDERVVRDGRVLTAAGVSAGIDLALTLLAELCGEDEARIAQLLLEYDPQPPFDSGHVSTASPDIRRRAMVRMTRLAANPRDGLNLPRVLARRWLERLRAR